MSPYSVRDEPGFEPTYDEDEQITIRKGDLRAVLDVAVGSMDYGSGFLDNEQVEALRKGAELLGVDPKIVTPTNFVCRYEGHHDWPEEGDMRFQPRRWVCRMPRCTANVQQDRRPDW